MLLECPPEQAHALAGLRAVQRRRCGMFRPRCVPCLRGVCYRAVSDVSAMPAMQVTEPSLVASVRPPLYGRASLRFVYTR
jgi:hypothetical protein